MVTTILLITLFIIFGAMVAQKRFKIITQENGQNKLNFKPIVFLVVGLLFVLFQPYSVKKIEAGYQGLLVNLIGDSRGASSIQ